MKKTLTALALILCACSIAMAQPDETYNATLKKMFQVSGSEKTYSTVIVQMISIFKEQYPAIDAAVWNEFADEFLQTSLDDLTEMLAPVYFKHLTQTDLEAIIDFYKSATGKKFASKTPMIMQESMQVGQVWGQKIGEEFSRKLEERGYIVN